MSEPLILSALKAKRVEIEKHIESLNARLTDARADLIHIAATVRLFDPSAHEDKPVTGYRGATKFMAAGRTC